VFGVGTYYFPASDEASRVRHILLPSPGALARGEGSGVRVFSDLNDPNLNLFMIQYSYIFKV
jgi:hypothetical protein